MACECKKVADSEFCRMTATACSKTPFLEWNDPLLGTRYGNQNQGPCCFIASLSAVAWIWPYNLEPFKCRTPSSTEADGTRKYKIPFRFPTENIEINEKVALEDSSYCFSRSRDAQELWVALYEKAYARKLTQADKCDSYTGVPWPGNPIDPLKHITGYSPNSEIDSTKIYSKIQSKCFRNKTKYATVVWSSSHAYSVLGYMQYNSTEYLVLRDPIGSNPYIRSDIVENIDWSIPEDFVWNPSTNLKSTCPCRGGSLTIPLKDGMFGLKYDKVKDYFQGVAWAGPI